MKIKIIEHLPIIFNKLKNHLKIQNFVSIVLEVVIIIKLF